MTRNLEACAEAIIWMKNEARVDSIWGEVDPDGDLNAIRLGLSRFWSGGESSSFVGKMSKIPGQLLLLVKRVQAAARVGGQPLSQPWTARHPTGAALKLPEPA